MVLVSGVVGDGWLGLQAALGKIEADEALNRYRLPRPRLALRTALASAHACADVSDGLLADAGHIGAASHLGVEIDLDRLPLSLDGRRYVAEAVDRRAALVRLATGGDDYELVCTAASERTGAVIAAAEQAGIDMTVVGRMIEGQGVRALVEGREVAVAQTGYRHG
jgi:thiamine-monophosphate kinase